MHSKISVVMPVCGNDYERISLAVRSVFEQTFQDYLLIIIIDDPHNTYLFEFIASICKNHRDKVKIVINSKQKGVAESLNTGIEFSKSLYIARMDADDISMPDRLEKQFYYMEKNTEVGILGMQALNVDENNHELGITRKPLMHDKIKEFSSFACPLVHPTWFIKRQVYIDLGYYKDMSPAQDYHFIVKALQAGIIINNMNDIGLKYTVRKKSTSRKSIFKTIAITELIRCSMVNKYSNDSDIEKIINNSTNMCSGYFEALYSMRSNFTNRYKNSTNVVYKLFNLIMIVLLSSMHTMLLKDTIAVYKSTKIS